MRITAGSLKGRMVDIPSGKTTRPLLSRVRQALFDTLGPELPGANVLDCFAGTGIFGFEALSRGAESVTAIELDRKTLKVIERNRDALSFNGGLRPNQFTLRQGDAREQIKMLAATGRVFDVIFVAPPYHQGLCGEMLAILNGDAQILDADGVLVLQYEKREADEFEPPAGFSLEKEKRYGSIHFYFLRRPALV